ncbi:hypothetical protein S83_004009 [Arachis hypogaea]
MQGEVTKALVPRAKEKERRVKADLKASARATEKRDGSRQIWRWHDDGNDDDLTKLTFIAANLCLIRQIYSRSPPAHCVVQIGCSYTRVLPPSPSASVAGTTYRKFRPVLPTIRRLRMLLQIHCSILLTVLAFLS